MSNYKPDNCECGGKSYVVYTKPIKNGTLRRIECEVCLLRRTEKEVSKEAALITPRDRNRVLARMKAVEQEVYRLNENIEWLRKTLEQDDA